MLNSQHAFRIHSESYVSKYCTYLTFASLVCLTELVSNVKALRYDLGSGGIHYLHATVGFFT